MGWRIASRRLVPVSVNVWLAEEGLMEEDLPPDFADAVGDTIERVQLVSDR